MPGKISNKLLLAVSIFILIAGFAIYLIIKDRGHKKEPVPASNVAADKKDSLIVSEMFSASYDLETSADLENYAATGAWSASSGKNSCWMNSKTEYSVTVKKKLSSIKNFSNIREVDFSFSAKAKNPVKNAVSVMSVDGPDGKSVEWIGKNISIVPGEWQRFEFSYEINKDKLSNDASIKLYVWNKTGEDFFIDDLQVKINGLVSSRTISSAYIPERNIEYDFEIPFEGENPEFYSTKNAHSGKLSYLLNSSTTYSPSVTKKVSEVIDSELKLVTMSMWLNQQTADNEVVLVATIKDQSGKEYFWQGRSSEKGKFPKGEWVKHRAQFKLPFEKINPDDIISIYAWNKGGKEVFVDDFLVVFGETNVRGGKVPAMDMTTVNENGFVFARNKAPFKTKYLQLLSGVKEGASMFDDIILPSDPVCSASLVSNVTAREQLVRISDGSLRVYDYCESQKKMNQIAKLQHPSFKNMSPGSLLASGNFTGNGSAALLFADRNKHSVVLGAIEGLKEGCLNPTSSASFKIICRLAGEQFETFLPGKYSHTLTGDFNGDNLTDVLFVNPETGIFAVLGFKNSIPVLLSNGNESDDFKINAFSQGGSVNIIRPLGSNHDVVILSWTENGINKSKALEFKSDLKTFAAIPSWKSTMISGTADLYQGNYSGQGSQVLLLNRTWKFDFTFGGFDSGEIFIDSQLEFTGFAPGYNPKFYEDVTIVSGRFTGGKKTELAVISAICNDPAFPSEPCKNYEMKSGWKPVTQLYYFKD